MVRSAPLHRSEVAVATAYAGCAATAAAAAATQGLYFNICATAAAVASALRSTSY